MDLSSKPTPLMPTSDAAPPPPPKDPYTRLFFSRSAVSLVPDSGMERRLHVGRAAASSPVPSASGRSLGDLANTDGSTDSSGSCPNANGIYTLNGASASAYTMGQSSTRKRSVFKLASFAKRNKSKKDLSDVASASGSASRGTSVSEQHSAVEGDEGISTPWNFQHNIHVDEGYIGLPPSWTTALSQVGFNEDEIAAIHARRRAAASGTSPTSPSSTVLLDPVPRSTSLVRGLHSPSAYSVTSTTGRTSLVPSPKAPSFSVRSFVSGIKNSLTADSASTKSGVGGSSKAVEESEQYVLVVGDSPSEQDEPYLYDTRIRQPSQGQQTPRIPAFPQIQVQRAHSDAGYMPPPSSAARAPSPLAHSASLPIPTPPRGHRQGPVSAPLPRTPPRRIYHVANASSDSYDGTSYGEPPPAYVSPEKGAWIPNKEKEAFGPPLPNRPIPPVPPEERAGEPSGLGIREENQEAFMSGTPGSSADGIPATADEVLDIASYYGDISAHGEGAEVDPAHQAISPTPPLVIDKRMAKLATLPPRLSFHQESTLEDWSESLFSAIGKEKRSSILMGAKRTSLWRTSPLMVDDSVSAAAPICLSPETVALALPDISLGPTIDAVEEGDEPEQVAEEPLEEDAEEPAADVDTTILVEEEEREEDTSPAAPSTPVLPDVSLGPDASSPEPISTPPSPPPTESPRKTSVDSLPPSPPPKPKLAPIIIPSVATLAPPRTSIIPGISGRSPVNPLFGTKPQPLPIPIPPSQIRAQLRPPPPKPPPTLSLPPLKRLPSQVNLLPLPQLPLSPSPQKSPKHASRLYASPLDSRRNSSQTLLTVHSNGYRDSGMSLIPVTPATITTAKTELVRTAIASVVDSDTVSSTSKRESDASTAEPEPDDRPDIDKESPHTRKRGEAPNGSPTPESSSVSLLRDGPQSKWPTPPPPPVELETDPTPRRLSRFRTTSLGRVSQLQAMASPIGSHFSRGSSETMSSSTCESAPLTTPKGVNGVAHFAKPKTNGTLAPQARFLTTAGTFGGVDDVESEGEEDGEAAEHPVETSCAHPLLAQLQPHISPRDPASCFTDLVEIAEGESGSVFAARVAPSFAHEDPPDAERPIPSGTSHVAIKRIPLPPVSSSPSLSDDGTISNKLVSVLHELCVLKGLEHEHLLLLDAIYACSSASAVDTSLWIRMELMERSLADVIGLVSEGLALQERLIARFASDVLHGLDYLARQQVAHRDVRSDNLLVNASGVVKLADFSSAVRVDRNAPIVSGAVGVIYWQAPEMRAGPYNALKVDIWSLGATVWELAETVPPFSTPASPSTQVSFAIQTARQMGPQWPPLSHPEHYSRPFHEFMRLCGRESAGRPSPGELLNTPFIRNACGRAVILQLLAQCRAIEETIAARES